MTPLRRGIISSRAALSTSAMAEIDTLIFDIDDTLYPMSCGFSDHRNGKIICGARPPHGSQQHAQSHITSDLVRSLPAPQTSW